MPLLTPLLKMIWHTLFSRRRHHRRQLTKGPIKKTTAFGAPGVRINNQKRAGSADTDPGAGGDEFLVRQTLAEALLKFMRCGLHDDRHTSNLACAQKNADKVVKNKVCS